MYKRILIATDGSELALDGVEQGVALAAALKAEVAIMTVTEPLADGFYDPPGWPALYASLEEYRNSREGAAQERLAPALEIAQRAGVPASTHHVPDRYAAEGIVETAEAQGADLIVMASHGRRGLGRLLLGSQTQQVLTHSKIPVLVVR